MTTRRFLTTVLVAVLPIAAALALAELLDAPWLRVVAVVLLVVIFTARETWQWWGAGRQWLAVNGALIGVVALAFVAPAPGRLKGAAERGIRPRAWPRRPSGPWARPSP